MSQNTKNLTISDVAQALGVSRTTVSAALSGNGRLSDETRELVQREAQKLGYQADYFAQNLRRQRQDLIGFFSPDLDLGVSTLKMQKMWALLDERGYTVPILAYGNREGGQFIEQEKLLAELRRQKPRAILCNTSNLQSEAAHAELQRYLDEGGIAVCYDWELPVETDRVIFDRQHNTYTATKHLLEMGHREIGFCPLSRACSSNVRTRGFRQAMDEFGAAVREEWILSAPLDLQFDVEAVALAEKFLALPSSDRPTAMCIVGDYVAQTFALHLTRAGLQIPADLSIVSHDDLPIAQNGFVPLSSVSHPYERIAQLAVEMLDSRLTGRYNGPPRCETVRGQLAQRHSVARIN